MQDVKAIEDAVRSLPPEQLAQFRRWFAECDAAAWDARIEAALASGKFDDLVAEARADFDAGGRQEP